MVDLLVSHFHFGIFEPERDGSMIDVERTLPNGSSSLDLFLGLFPLSVLDPVGEIETIATNVVFELFSLF